MHDCGGSCETSIYETETFEPGVPIRPGGLEQTDENVKAAGFKAKDKVIDVGCGRGLTVEHLIKEYDIDAVGIDPSAELLSQGKERVKDLPISQGDAEYLDYPSFTFDGVIYECVLSLVKLQPEALHESFCVLKNKGKVVISDFYFKEDSSVKKREDNPIPANCCLNGAFIKEELISMVENCGLKVLSFEDKTVAMKAFMAQIILEHGSMEAFWETTLPKDASGKEVAEKLSKSKLGYFTLIAEKA